MEIEYPKDVAKLRKMIPELSTLTDRQVADFYHEWSEITYSAGWLIMTNRGIRAFREWLIAAPINRK